VYSQRGRLLAQLSRPGSRGYRFANGTDVFATDSLTAVAAECGYAYATDNAGVRLEEFRDPRAPKCPKLGR
jgi:hypothetical protein